jgi:hypothetical protein
MINRHKMKKHFLLFFFLILIPGLLISKEDRCFSVGIRLQKTHHLYYENGVAFDFTSQALLNKKIHVGFSYVTSRLGTAFHSNALKQDNYLLSCSYHFRHEKIICPVITLNTGYFYADMEESFFEVIPHKSLLLSAETGIFLNLNYPVKVKSTVGFNFITGDGTSGPGTLYPLYIELSIFYQFIKK